MIQYTEKKKKNQIKFNEGKNEVLHKGSEN